MSSRRFQVLIVGVGGQGVLTAAGILGDAAHAAGIPVSVGQLHGMSQRGGSVECSVILGEGEASFVFGDALDVLIAYEPLEALRAEGRVGKATRVLLNVNTIPPSEVVLGNAEYPSIEEIVRRLAVEAASVHALDATEILGAGGLGRALNVLLLGAAAGLELVPIAEELVLAAALARCGERFRDANTRAFAAGNAHARKLKTSAVFSLAES